MEKREKWCFSWSVPLVGAEVAAGPKEKFAILNHFNLPASVFYFILLFLNYSAPTLCFFSIFFIHYCLF